MSDPIVATACEPLTWVQWLARMDFCMRRFCTETIPVLPQPYWSDSAIDCVCRVFAEFIPTMESIPALENFDTVDLFVRWVGQTSVHRAGMKWFSHPHAAQGIYRGFGPALRDPMGEVPTVYVIEVLEWAVQDGLDRVREVFIE